VKQGSPPPTGVAAVAADAAVIAVIVIVAIVSICYRSSQNMAMNAAFYFCRIA